LFTVCFALLALHGQASFLSSSIKGANWMISNTALVLMLLRETGCLDSYEENTLKQELQSGDCHQGFGIFISYIPY